MRDGPRPVTPACVAPRHVDAPRDFLIFYFIIYYFFSERAARGGGGGVRCQTFSFSFFPCSADHERDWPPCKVVFFGLATNALNVRNNNNNNNNMLEQDNYYDTTPTTTLLIPSSPSGRSFFG